MGVIVALVIVLVLTVFGMLWSHLVMQRELRLERTAMLESFERLATCKMAMQTARTPAEAAEAAIALRQAAEEPTLPAEESRRPVGLKLDDGNEIELLSPQAQDLYDRLPQERLIFDDAPEPESE